MESEMVRLEQDGRVKMFRLKDGCLSLVEDANPVVERFLLGEDGIEDLIRSAPTKDECRRIDVRMDGVLSPVYRIYSKAEHEFLHGTASDPYTTAYFEIAQFFIKKIGREKYMEMLAEKAKED
jgi:hypothetical protein